MRKVIADIPTSFRAESAVDHDVVGPEGINESRATVLAIADLEGIRCFVLLVFERVDQISIVRYHYDVGALKVNLPVVIAVQTVAFTKGLCVTDLRLELGHLVATLSPHFIYDTFLTPRWNLVTVVVLPAIVR